MSIGYVAGKQYRVDKDADRFIQLEPYKKLLQYLRWAGIAAETKYSHVGRNYTTELKEVMRFKKSAQLYMVSLAMKHGPDPLSSLISAIRQVMNVDDYLAVLLLESEIASWTISLADMREFEAKLDKQLDALRMALDTIVIDYVCENCIGMIAHGCYCKTMGALVPGGPAVVIDEDDDL